MDNNPNSSKKLFCLKEAAEILNVSVGTLLQWNDHHILKPTITLEGTIGYTEEQINQFLAIRQLFLGEKSSTEKSEISSQAGISQNEPIIAPKLQTPSIQPVENIGSVGIVSAISENASGNSKGRPFSFHLISSALVVVLILGISVFTQAGGLKTMLDQSGLNYQKETENEKILGAQTSKPEFSGGTAFSPAQLKKESTIGSNLSSEGDGVLKDKINALNFLYGNAPKTDISVRKPQDLAQAAVQQGQAYPTFLLNSSTANAAFGDLSSFPTYSSRTTEGNTDNNTVFDDSGKIKGEAKDTLATTLGGIGLVAGADSLKQATTPANWIMLLVAGLLALFFVFPKRPVYVDKDIQSAQFVPESQIDLATEKIIEVGQKTDGTIVLYFGGKEYKVSKPELYSESDQFIEKLMDIVKPGVKEIEYVIPKDEAMDMTTPLSRLVTRLGFVGVKRDLFFPRTSKDRVLFRKYLTMQDLIDMNLTTDKILNDFTMAV